ncbi:hypothetical protein GOV11_00870 [Candidatus Woesearchaeota archaeon]|nr:hypothetical protein [Candidatus Woesearchaeota archaeon]
MATFTEKDGDLYIDSKKVLRGWESFTGWYWFATEKECEQESDLGDGVGVKDTIWFGFVQGMEEEWGSFSQAEIESLAPRTWEIPKANLPISGRRN